MYQARLDYLKKIDIVAESISERFIQGEIITQTILETIIELYKSAKVEQHFKNIFFENENSISKCEF